VEELYEKNKSRTTAEEDERGGMHLNSRKHEEERSVSAEDGSRGRHEGIVSWRSKVWLTKQTAKATRGGKALLQRT